MQNEYWNGCNSTYFISAGSYNHTDFCELNGAGRVEEDGPLGYASIVATGWD